MLTVLSVSPLLSDPRASPYMQRSCFPTQGSAREYGADAPPVEAPPPHRVRRPGRADAGPSQPEASTSGGSGFGAPSARSVEEIKAKYGHGRQGAAASADERGQSAAGVMGQNVAMMQERGERLGRLGERAEEMAGDAAGFADLARQLSKQSRGGMFGLMTAACRRSPAFQRPCHRSCDGPQLACACPPCTAC